jgi:alkaline phosphatase
MVDRRWSMVDGRFVIRLWQDRFMSRILTLSLAALLAAVHHAGAATTIRIMPPDGAILAAGQRFDIRVEATADGAEPPRGLTVTVNGRDVTSRNVLDAGPGGERGAGGTGAAMPAGAGTAPKNSSNYLLRGFAVERAGPLVIEAAAADGAKATARLTVEGWTASRTAARARNIILLLGDGMGAAHRTAARIVSRGVRNGRAAGRLAMDTLDVTGLVMTPSLNSVITDSSPGMAAYATGQKNNNNQSGVFPDNTADPFDNPRIEYIGELLRRTRGRGFNVGIVTTADVTDSTPAANAAHTADRYAGAGIAAQIFDERDANGVSVLLGGGARHFMPKGAGGGRPDDRRLAQEFEQAGYARLSTGRDVRALLSQPTPPKRILGLFHDSHMPVAFDKVGAGRYSDELARPENARYRDTPMLEDLTRAAIASLSAHSPAGFYLMVEGASIDKRAHAVDAERTIWDVIELDRAVEVALAFARRTNSDADPSNDTLVIVTADHECGGLGIIGVGNERYAPARLGKSVRDYAAVFRFAPDQQLNFFPNYVVDERGYPVDPDPSRKLLLGWAAEPDHYENWLANRVQLEAAVVTGGVSVANPARDGAGEPIPGFLVPGTIENGATGCPVPEGCPGDTAAMAQSISGHTASDVPLSATGPGAWQFTGVYENADAFLKMLRSAAGSYPSAGASANRTPGRRP